MVAKEELNKTSSDKQSRKINLKSLRYDWYQSEETVTCIIYVKQTIRESIKLEYHDQNCIVSFKTIDKSFLNDQNADQNDVFVLNIELNDKIDAGQSLFKSSNCSIEINLVKKSIKKWHNLLKEEIEQEFTKKVQNRSPSSSRSPSPQPKPIQKSNSNLYGHVGLANLGNTCYMNAALQFLANATDLRDYFCNFLIKF